MVSVLYVYVYVTTKGPGSVCTTRKQTGVGYPQLSAVLECADAAHGLGGMVVSDGGCTCPGDFSKAFGAGSDFVSVLIHIFRCDFLYAV